MNVIAIVANVIDRCGGNLIEKFPSDIATLHVLNVMERFGLQLAQTFKGSFAIKYGETWNAKNGQVSPSAKFIDRPQYVRCRDYSSGWKVLDVVNDIEELTHAENKGIRAVFFSKVKPFDYHLSFTPGSLAVEIWGQHVTNFFNRSLKV